jgi:hypothetical protein
VIPIDMAPSVPPGIEMAGTSPAMTAECVLIVHCAFSAVSM